MGSIREDSLRAIRLGGSLNIFVAHPSRLLTDCRPNGDGLVAFGFLKHLAERGHRIHVAVERCDIEEPLPQNIVLHEIGNRNRTTSRLAFMYRMRRLFERLRRTERFDLVHQMNPVFAGLSLALVGAHIPIVLGTYIAEWPKESASSLPEILRRTAGQPVKRALVALQQHYANALLLTTPAAAERVVGLASNVHKVFMLPNGVDVDRFEPSNRDDDGLTIVSLCGLAHRKGAYVLLEAFKQVLDAVPQASLTIGGAAAAPELDAARLRLGHAAGRVNFVGPVSRDALPGLLRGGSVFCMPSYGEPYGMAALEAMSCGLPVVATDGGGLAHLVPEQGGKKVPQGYPDALAAALITLLGDRDLRRSCGSYNRSIVLSKFAWPRVMERLEFIYAGILSTRSEVRPV